MEETITDGFRSTPVPKDGADWNTIITAAKTIQ
jgi:hypothetical protein